MSKLLQVRIDDKLKTAADGVFTSMGLDTSTAVRMFLTAAVETRSIPFDVKSRTGVIELADGYGSYICEYGHVHDYSKLEVVEGDEVIGPFDNVEDALRSLKDE
ncbi:MAG: type II toxin-antitoxin system RelB/DinJ family antitoxin [Propionibacteriaceae bacterium]|jgi:DNA-damage-inducible protein J|nr:type II toxin-antitoxin system RelB/DinJ family antitoxin [Propionibacteriaceae bacterium]